MKSCCWRGDSGGKIPDGLLRPSPPRAKDLSKFDRNSGEKTVWPSATRRTVCSATHAESGFARYPRALVIKQARIAAGLLREQVMTTGKDGRDVRRIRSESEVNPANAPGSSSRRSTLSRPIRRNTAAQLRWQPRHTIP